MLVNKEYVWCKDRQICGIGKRDFVITILFSCKSNYRKYVLRSDNLMYWQLNLINSDCFLHLFQNTIHRPLLNWNLTWTGFSWKTSLLHVVMVQCGKLGMIFWLTLFYKTFQVVFITYFKELTSNYTDITVKYKNL